MERVVKKTVGQVEFTRKKPTRKQFNTRTPENRKTPGKIRSSIC
jgi:hypothetical protein